MVNKKHVFWQALILTFFVFFIGLLMGIAFENRNINQIEEYYSKSEISMVDINALNSLIDAESDCELLFNSNVDFANRVYIEARELENVAGSERLIDSENLHIKYDLLRTFVWINSIKIREKCSQDFSTIVYLYEFKTDDLAKKATQNVWSNILVDLKEERGDSMLLIPIGADADLVSTNYLIKQFNITRFPSLIINDEFVLTEIDSSEQIESYLD